MDMVTGAVAQHDLRVASVAHPHYVMLARIAARDTRSVIDALVKQSKHLPDEL